MNSKNKLIEKLLKTAKDHKVLTYPVLALVAIISVINYFFSWSSGAGKRVVAVIMVLVMLVSQSYFLTSSATALVDDANAALVQKELQEESSKDESVAQESTTEGKQDVSAENTKEKTATEASGSETQGTEEAAMQESVSGTEASSADATGDTAADASEDTIGTEDETALPGDPEVHNEDADALADDAETVQKAESTGSCDIYFVTTDATGTHSCYSVTGVPKTWSDEKDAYVCDISGHTQSLENSVNSVNNNPYYTYCSDGLWYYSSTCTGPTATLNAIEIGKSVSEVTFYCKREIKNYDLTVRFVEKNSGKELKTSYTYNGNNDTGTSLKPEDGIPAGDALALTNIKCSGYELSSAVCTTGSATVSYGKTGSYTYNCDVVCTSNGQLNESAERTVTLYFEPATYFLQYALKENGRKQEVQYNDSSTLWAPGEGVVPYESGYTFDGWCLSPDDTKKADATVYQTNITVPHGVLYNPDNDTVPLYPHYKYKGIELIGFSKESKIELEYHVPFKEYNIKATYVGKAEGDTEDFEYVLESTVSNTLANYGLKATADGNGVTLSAMDKEGPTRISGSNITLRLNFTVTDKNNTEDCKQEFNIPITIGQHTVTIKGTDEDDFKKEYDGTDVIGDKFPEELEAEDNAGKKVTITYTSAKYLGKDVGTHQFEFEGLKVKGLTEAEQANYRIMGGDSLTGEITPREILVVGKAEPDTIYTGEEKNGITYSAQEYIREGHTTGLVGEDATAGFDTVILPFVEGYLEENEVLVSETEFEKIVKRRVGVKFKQNAVSNYTIGTVTNLQHEIPGTYVKIIEEKPVGLHEGKIKHNYVIGDGSYEAGGWINANTATIGIQSDVERYNTVYLNDQRYINLNGLPDSSSPDGTDYNIQLKNEETGAHTSVGTVNLKIDKTQPEFCGFRVESQDKIFADTVDSDDKENLLSVPGGLYFPGVGGTVSFGNYFNKTVKVTLKFQDTASGVAEIDFLNQVCPIAQKDRADDGSVTAVFEMNAEVAENMEGIKPVSFSAKDVAGNQTGIFELAGNGANEWMVEQTKPTITGFSIIGSKNKGSDGNYYYSKDCEVSLKVTDSQSGIREVKWNVNGVEDEKSVMTPEESKQKIYEFRAPVNTDSIAPLEQGDKKGIYRISATVSDNAGNVVGTNQSADIESPITCQIDPDEPVIRLIDADMNEIDVEALENGYCDTMTLRFKTWDTLSGVAYITVVGEDNTIVHHDEYNETMMDGYNTTIGSFVIDHVENYTIKVRDYAGNEAEFPIHLKNVSKEVPNCPEVSISPKKPDGANGWYKEKPTVTVYPSRSLVGENVYKMVTKKDNIPVDTQYTMARKGQQDLTPIRITEDEVNGKNIQFHANGEYTLAVTALSKGGVSCAEPDKHQYTLKVDDEAPEIVLKPEKGNGTSLLVTFTITDKASGVDIESIKVKHNGADVVVKGSMNEDGTVYTGSFEITETGSYSVEAVDIAGNKATAPAFTPMSMKVKAVTNITETAATVGAAIIKGSADVKSAKLEYRRYTDKNYRTVKDAAVSDGSGNVSVSAVLSGLTKGTSYVYKITATSQLGEVLEYEGYFKTLNKNVEGISINGVARYADGSKDKSITVGLFDGRECVMATEITAGGQFVFDNVPDGNYNIVATDGKYSKTIRVLIEDGMIVYPNTSIELVLSGKNTSVVLTTENTPNITVDNMDSIFDNDTVNYTDDDRYLVEEEGGMVEFKLYATLMTVSSVSPEEISAMYAVTSSGKIVGAYLDLSLYKIVTDEKGSSSSRVTELGNGANISVTIPLGDLAGKPGLEVIRIHNTGEEFLGKYLYDEDSNPNTYTISTDQFSTYAVLYDADASSTEKPSVKPTTEAMKEGTANPSQNGAIYNHKKDIEPDDGIGKRPIEPDTSTRAGGSGRSSVGTLRSSGSPRTGDAAPVAAMGSIMVISIAGFFIMRRKLK